MSASVKLLLIDAGNTRIKWAVYRAQEKVLESTQAHDYQNSTWTQQLKQQLIVDACARIILCSVAGAGITQAITKLSVETSTPLQTLANGLIALGLSQTNYQNPQQLGVDRCLLMIGARATVAQGRLCVVSCGTALTLDVLDQHGRHLGGIISASPRSIRQKMVQDAAGINVDIDLPSNLIKIDSVFTQSTEQALYNGSALSAIGLVQQVWQQLQGQDEATTPQSAWRLLYSGGGMPELLPYLPTEGVYYPDLIMTGLAAIADN